MVQRPSREESEEHLLSLVRKMNAELCEWRDKHPEASLDDIADQVTPRRRQLIGEWIAQLACQHGDGATAERPNCPACGRGMVDKGKVRCAKQHLEGEIRLNRAYYFCPACGQKVFPPRRASTVG
jgi:hypothetical protein